MCWELLDILSDSQQHLGCGRMVAAFHQALDDDIRMENHQTTPQLLRQSQFLPFEVLVGPEEQRMSLLVIAHLLLLFRNDERCASCLHVVSEGLVEAVNIVWILG